MGPINKWEALSKLCGLEETCLLEHIDWADNNESDKETQNSRRWCVHNHQNDEQGLRKIEQKLQKGPNY